MVSLLSRDEENEQRNPSAVLRIRFHCVLVLIRRFSYFRLNMKMPVEWMQGKTRLKHLAFVVAIKDEIFTKKKDERTKDSRENERITKIWNYEKLSRKNSWRHIISFSHFSIPFFPSCFLTSHSDFILINIRCRQPSVRRIDEGKEQKTSIQTHKYTQWANRKTTASDSIIIRHMEQREPSHAQVLMSIVILLVIIDDCNFSPDDLFDSVIFAVDFLLSFHNCIDFGWFISWKCYGTSVVCCTSLILP